MKPRKRSARRPLLDAHPLMTDQGLLDECFFAFKIRRSDYRALAIVMARKLLELTTPATLGRPRKKWMPGDLLILAGDVAYERETRGASLEDSLATLAMREPWRTKTKGNKDPVGALEKQFKGMPKSYKWAVHDACEYQKLQGHDGWPSLRRKFI
jgi:hypothetical protein